MANQNVEQWEQFTLEMTLLDSYLGGNIYSYMNIYLWYFILLHNKLGLELADISLCSSWV